MKTLLNCGCEITVYDDGSGVDIEYCNMHWKAPEMLEALKAAQNAMSYDLSQSTDEYERALRAVNAVIAMAEAAQ